MHRSLHSYHFLGLVIICLFMTFAAVFADRRRSNMTLGPLRRLSPNG